MEIKKLICWYERKHTNYVGENTPIKNESIDALNDLMQHLLEPIQNKFGEVTITYGFTSFELLKYIKKHSPGDMAPELDQHASFEVNSKGNRICKRYGAACDIFVEGFEKEFRLSLLHYPTFYSDSYPALHKSINVDLVNYPIELLNILMLTIPLLFIVKKL